MVSKIDKLHKFAVSKHEISRLKEWMGEDNSKLSFDSLFEGKLRLVIPFNTKEQKELLKIISFLRENEWEPAGGNNFFDVKTVMQKRRRADTGEEYAEEAQVADLKVFRKEKRTIPSGPRKGEEVLQKKVMSISKVLSNPKNNVPPELFEWWQDKQAEYVKSFNWQQIESAFQDGMVKSDRSIILSRDPVDVLRMSDHTNIQSCHSEGNSYFNCAISESKGNGLIAYLVDTNELNKLLTVDPTTGTGVSQREIGELDKEEIFKDPNRGVKGISPKSRVRLRKYINEEEDYEFAAPEHRTYGPHPPGFVDLVREWAWEKQKHLFVDWDETTLPESYDLKMCGGSYRDTPDGEVLNSFFETGGIDTDFYGDVETLSDDEQSRFEMWIEEIDEIVELANTTLKHATFSASIEEEEHVWSSASLRCSIPLTGWTESYIDGDYVTHDGFESIYTRTWGGDREFLDMLEHPEGGELTEVSVTDDNILIINIDFNCEDCSNPDDVSSFLEYMKRDVDGSYDNYVEGVRRELVDGGYIAEKEFDRVDKRLEEVYLVNFNILGDRDDHDGEIVISSKPNVMPLDITIPKQIINESLGLDSIETALNVERVGTTYKLEDELTIVLRVLTQMAKKAFEEAELQLNFPWYEKAESPIDYSKAIENFEMAIHINKLNIHQMNVRMKIRVNDSDSHTLFIENFLEIVDQNVETIVNSVKESLINKIRIASEKAASALKSFYDGQVVRPLIEELKAKPQPDVKRLALWIEANWGNFSFAEKEVAYFSYLLPTIRDGDYLHKDSLDSPRFWNQSMQGRHDTDVSYKWNGISIKDVMPYTQFEEEPEQNNEHEISYEESN